MTNPRKKKGIKQEFTATSKLIQYNDYSLGYKVKTTISYEFGILKEKHAIRFYIDGDFESIRFINKKVTEENFKMYKSGGQTLWSIRRQREKCLELIVKKYFESYGFKVKLKPKLNIFKPDILIKKENLVCFIELKAYHESYICGDAEISQVMKYFRETTNSKKSLKLHSKPKFILITSGSIINFQDSFLNQKNVDPVQYVSLYYKKLIIPRSKIKKQDDFSKRDIYNQASKKFKTNYSNGFPLINVRFLKMNQTQNFPSCLFSNKDYEVLLIGSHVFSNLLKHINLSREFHKFKLLKEKDIERLIINGKILKYP